MLNPFINAGLEVALKELFRDQYNTEQIYQVTDLKKTRLIVYVSPHSLRFVFVDETEEQAREAEQSLAKTSLPQYRLQWQK